MCYRAGKVRLSPIESPARTLLERGGPSGRGWSFRREPLFTFIAHRIATRLKWTGILDMRPAGKSCDLSVPAPDGGDSLQARVCLLRHIRSRILAAAARRSYAACSFAIACG